MGPDPSPLWDWVDVSKWLCLRGKVHEGEYRSALVSRIVNYHVQTDQDYEAAKSEVEEAMSKPLLSASTPAHHA